MLPQIMFLLIIFIKMEISLPIYHINLAATHATPIPIKELTTTPDPEDDLGPAYKLPTDSPNEMREIIKENGTEWINYDSIAYVTENMNLEFNEKFSLYLQQKSFTYIPTKEKYDSIMEAVMKKATEEKPIVKNQQERNWMARFSVKMIDGKPVLYRDEKLVVKQEEIFDKLHETHIRLVHPGRDIMEKELGHIWGLSREIISIYLGICKECELKKSKVKKGLVVKPIQTKEFNERAQVDLIDLQARPDGDYKFLMVYQDHLTKFCVLNALETKTALEVAEHLIKIFGTFGAPKILHSDNGREFSNQIVREVVRKWPGCRIVHGKPRHSQSQGSVERCNRDIGDMLTMWLRDNNTTKWASALPFIQAAKNRRHHSGIGRSPFEALFGRKLVLGCEKEPQFLRDPDDEDKENDEEESIEEFITIDGTDFVIDVDDRVIELELEDEQNDENDFSGIFDERDQNIEANREGAKIQQQRQAKKMLETSGKKFPPLDVGQNVRVPVPEFDRSKIDPRNMIGIVQEVTENGLYKIGTKSGTLDQLYSRNQIEPFSSNSHMNTNDVPGSNISLRTAVGAESLSGTQGYVHCSCTTKCVSMRCKCLKLERKCNSRCHGSLNCNNK